MRILLSIALFLSVSPAFASDSPCVTKQKNAASFEIAQKLGVAVQSVEVVSFQGGPWTPSLSDNTGMDTVTVRAGSRTNEQVTQKYQVFAEQIGATDDCKVFHIVEATT